MALAYPKDIATSSDSDDKFYIEQYFRIIWAVPVIIAVVQSLLLSTCFANESPVYLKEKNMEDELRRVMGKFYETSEVENRLNDLDREVTQ